MLLLIREHFAEIAAFALFGIGLTNLMLSRNMIKKIIGFNMIDSAIYLFLASYGYIQGRKSPILDAAGADLNVQSYVNPLPAGLVLTGIVVSVSVTAIMLALTVMLYRRYHSIDIDEIARLQREAE